MKNPDPTYHDADPAPSPCIQICRIGDDEYCVGCRRTLAEIAQWSSLNDDEKRKVLDSLRAR